jgi:hypothetical protein
VSVEAAARGSRVDDVDVLDGSPVARLLELLHALHPEWDVSRLQVKYPADDDNLWFVGGPRELQFNCHPGGQGPFLIESAAQRHEADDPDAAMTAIERLMVDDSPG